jgi:hypothetical protein
MCIRDRHYGRGGPPVSETEIPQYDRCSFQVFFKVFPVKIPSGPPVKTEFAAVQIRCLGCMNKGNNGRTANIDLVRPAALKDRSHEIVQRDPGIVLKILQQYEFARRQSAIATGTGQEGTDFRTGEIDVVV